MSETFDIPLFLRRPENMTEEEKQQRRSECRVDRVVSVPDEEGYYWFKQLKKFSVPEVVYLHRQINGELFMFRMLATTGLPHKQIADRYPSAVWGEKIKQPAH